MCPRRPGEFCGRWMRDVGTSTDSMKADIKKAFKKEKQRQELQLTFATSPKRDSWRIYFKVVFFLKSDAVVKFVIFILKQCGVDGIPSFSSIKRKSFGTFDGNDFLMQVSV